MDLELEDEEDEDAIIERRRQLRQAIVDKYKPSAPTTPQQDASSPAAPSEADSDALGDKVKEELAEEGRRLEEAETNGDVSTPALIKDDPMEKMKAQEELKTKKTNFSALRAAIRNGDMFEEDFVTKVRGMSLFIHPFTLFPFLFRVLQLP